MENKAIRVLSICLVALFALAVIFFAIGLVIEYNKAPGLTQATLNQFTSDASVAAEYYMPGTQQFSEVLRARIAANNTIAVTTITHAQDVIFAYPLSSPYIEQGQSGQPAIVSSSALISVKSKEIDLSGNPYIVTCAMYRIQPGIIYAHIRTAFLVILAGTLVAGIALLYLYLTEQRGERSTPAFDDELMAQRLRMSRPYYPPRATEDSLDALADEGFILPEEDELPFSSEGDDDFSPEAMAFPPDEEESQPEDAIPVHHPVDADTRPELEGDEVQQDASAANTSVEGANNEHEAATIDEEAKGGSEPAGLFSPATGFGWESYLEERLDSELIRSASSEEDIGLMIIRIQGMDRNDPRNKEIYDTLLEFYKFRDLIFEYGNDGFSCIVHSVNVDAALALAEQVYLSITKILEESGRTNEVGIGISTRSFRLIPGKRIFMEAEQALVHAFEDSETAIVAFRVDPEKYRKYISEYAEEDPLPKS